MEAAQSSSSSSSLMLCRLVPCRGGERDKGGVLVKKGRRKVGEGERSSRVGLLLGLGLGLMACSIRPFPSFNMCFCSQTRRQRQVGDRQVERDRRKVKDRQRKERVRQKLG